MDKLGDIDLFVRVVKNSGLAAAGREIGLSPASMTARIKGLEQHYGVRLLNRTTRSVTLTDEGKTFFEACVPILADIEQAEQKLQTGREGFIGPLRITAASDLGQQHIAPVLSTFVKDHPGVTPTLYLTDGVVNLAEQGFDLGIRYGVLADSTMIAKRLARNRRVLCASPDYLKRKGLPITPDALSDHDCLAMVRVNELLNSWHFHTANGEQVVTIRPARASNDGALIRRWAVEGAGIALKSLLEVVNDLKAGRLVTLLDDYCQDFELSGASGGADLHVIYPNRSYMPQRTRGFIKALADHFSTLNCDI